MIVTDLWSSRGESTTFKVGFYPGNMQEGLARETKKTTGLVIRYEVMEISRLVSGHAGLGLLTV